MDDHNQADGTAINLDTLLSHFCANGDKPDTFELLALQSYVDRLALLEGSAGSPRRTAAWTLSAALENILLSSPCVDEHFLDNYLSVRHAERAIITRYETCPAD